MLQLHSTPQTSAATPPVETHHSNESPIHKSPIRESTPQVVTSKPTNHPGNNLQLLEMFYSVKIKGTGSTICCNIAAGIIQEDEVKTYIDESSLHALLYRDWLDATVINIYSSYLYRDILVPTGRRKRYVFIGPEITTAFVSSSEHDKVLGRILYNKRGQDKFFLLPYNHDGQHWVLCALSLVDFGKVYFLDSLRKDPTHYEPMKSMINKSFKEYRTLSGFQTSKNMIIPDPIWYRIQCPRQTNNSDCGLYVMRFMKEIINQNALTISREYFAQHRCPSYTTEQLDEVREEWAKHVVTTCL